MIYEPPSPETELEQQEKVYADLVTIYPENEGYLRRYAEILLESGKASTATTALKRLYALIEKKSPEKAAALAREFPQIGQINKIETEQIGSSEFGEMLRKDLGTLWIKMHQKKLKEGHSLYKIDDYGDSLALIVKGEVAVCIPGKGGKTVLLNLIGENDVVGEGCFLNPGQRSANIVANKDTVIVEVPRNKVVNFFIENPGAQKLLEEKADFRQMTSLLSTNELLQNIPLDMRKYMAGMTQTERYKPKSIIRQAGQDMDVVDMLIWGEVSYMLQNKSGKYMTLGKFKVGELVGDTSALRKATCPADIIAVTEVLMAHIPLACFTNVVEAYPPFKEKLMNYAQKQRTAMMHMVSKLGDSIRSQSPL